VKTTVADQRIEVLLQAGVQRIYRVAGDSLNPVVDAIRRTEGIGWVAVRNEEAGAFAAAAEAPAALTGVPYGASGRGIATCRCSKTFLAMYSALRTRGKPV
jgi:pyruvate dehydrogenase (quinone)